MPAAQSRSSNRTWALNPPVIGGFKNRKCYPIRQRLPAAKVKAVPLSQGLATNHSGEEMNNRTAAISLILIVLAVGTLSLAVAFQHLGAPQGQGTMVIEAWYATPSGDGSWVGSYRIVLVTVSGPLQTSGFTTPDRWHPLTLSLPPGTYAVSGTYYNGSQAIFKSISVTVQAGKTAFAFLNFGNSPPPP
jgi:hypothetical protein